MNQNIWINEVKRVAHVIGLDEVKAQELVLWSVAMAYDDRERASQYFSESLECPGLERAMDRLESRMCDAWGLDIFEEAVQ